MSIPCCVVGVGGGSREVQRSITRNPWLRGCDDVDVEGLMVWDGGLDGLEVLRLRVNDDDEAAKEPSFPYPNFVLVHKSPRGRKEGKGVGSLGSSTGS